MKAATAVNVRHILCEKHSRAMEALEKIQVHYIIILLNYGRHTESTIRAGNVLIRWPKNTLRIRRKVCHTTHGEFKIRFHI